MLVSSFVSIEFRSLRMDPVLPERDLFKRLANWMLLKSRSPKKTRQGGNNASLGRCGERSAPAGAGISNRGPSGNASAGGGYALGRLPLGPAYVGGLLRAWRREAPIAGGPGGGPATSEAMKSLDASLSPGRMPQAYHSVICELYILGLVAVRASAAWVKRTICASRHAASACIRMAGDGVPILFPPPPPSSLLL